MTDNPLFSALKKRKSSYFMNNSEDSYMKPIGMPRLFDFTQQELGKVRPGDPITVYVYGTVKSMDDEGCITVNITKVVNEHEKKEESNQEEKTIRVVTQESHSP